MIAFDIRCYDRLESTQDEARRLAQSGAAHGTVVVAGEQTAGRGRLGRTWISPPGNLYLSVLLRLDLPPRRVAELGFVVALAVADALDRFLPGRARLKWPNDILVDGGKVSGILIEQAPAATIVGIGVNVRANDDGKSAITSLASAGSAEPSVAVARTAVLDALARRLQAWQSGGFTAIRDAWLARAHPPGTIVHVSTIAGSIDGRFAGLADDGALLLDTDGGIRRVMAGDVLIG